MKNVCCCLLVIMLSLAVGCRPATPASKSTSKPKATTSASGKAAKPAKPSAPKPTAPPASAPRKEADSFAKSASDVANYGMGGTQLKALKKSKNKIKEIQQGHNTQVKKYLDE
jgi:predicted lipid-binding transport protein (Tim44 family)